MYNIFFVIVKIKKCDALGLLTKINFC